MVGSSRSNMVFGEIYIISQEQQAEGVFNTVHLNSYAAHDLFVQCMVENGAVGAGGLFFYDLITPQFILT